MSRPTVGLGVLVCSVASVVFAASAEKSVFTSPDGFVEIVTDTDLSPTEASAIAARIAAAYDFTRKEDQWADQTLLDPPLTVRVLDEVPEGLLGRATAPRTFLIQLAYARTPTSAATIAHELTHLQDFRQLKKKKLAQYWLEGRANSNAFAYRAHLVLGQNPDWKGRLARWTSDDARAVFAETVTSADHRAQVEELGTLWIEHLRRRFPDTHPRSAKLISAIAAGATLEAAYASAFGEPLEKARAEFLAYVDATQSDPDARVAGTWMQWSSTAGRTARESRAKGVNAVVEWGNGKAYLFRGSTYARFDIKADRMDPGFPKPLAGNWPGFPWTSGFDAAVSWGNGKVYFFKGDQYLRYDVKTDQIDPGFPKRMLKENWPGFPWIDGFDSAANWGDGSVSFFKDGESLRYELKTDKVGAPKPLAASWPGLPFTSGVDAAVNLGAGKAYFFLGSQYVRFDVASNRADPGFPQPVDTHWK